MGIAQSSFENQSATTVVGTFLICQASFDYFWNTTSIRDNDRAEELRQNRQYKNAAIMVIGAILVESSKHLCL